MLCAPGTGAHLPGASPARTFPLPQHAISPSPWLPELARQHPHQQQQIPPFLRHDRWPVACPPPNGCLLHQAHTQPADILVIGSVSRCPDRIRGNRTHNPGNRINPGSQTHLFLTGANEHGTSDQHQHHVAQRPAQPERHAIVPSHLGPAPVHRPARQQRQGRCRRSGHCRAHEHPGPRHECGHPQRQRRHLPVADRRGRPVQNQRHGSAHA